MKQLYKNTFLTAFLSILYIASNSTFQNCNTEHSIFYNPSTGYPITLEDLMFGAQVYYDDVVVEHPGQLVAAGLVTIAGSCAGYHGLKMAFSKNNITLLARLSHAFYGVPGLIIAFVPAILIASEIYWRATKDTEG